MTRFPLNSSLEPSANCVHADAIHSWSDFLINERQLVLVKEKTRLGSAPNPLRPCWAYICRAVDLMCGCPQKQPFMHVNALCSVGRCRPMTGYGVVLFARQSGKYRASTPRVAWRIANRPFEKRRSYSLTPILHDERRAFGVLLQQEMAAAKVFDWCAGWMNWD